MSIQIKELTHELLPAFRQYLKQDRFMNACVLRDVYYPNLRKKCKFYVAVNKKKIDGSATVYYPQNKAYPPAIWVSGSKESASNLCDIIHEDKATINTTVENSGIIEKRFPKANRCKADLMLIQKGKFSVKHDVKQVKPGEYIEERIILAGGKINKKTIDLWKKMDKEKEDSYTYIGFAGKNAVSTSSTAHVVDKHWLVGWTYTKPEYRKQGYATSVLSKALEDTFEKFGGKYAVLFVLGHNKPAITLYCKTGFKKIREMIWLEHNTDFLSKSIV